MLIATLVIAKPYQELMDSSSEDKTEFSMNDMEDDSEEDQLEDELEEDEVEENMLGSIFQFQTTKLQKAFIFNQDYFHSEYTFGILLPPPILS